MPWPADRPLPPWQGTDSQIDARLRNRAAYAIFNAERERLSAERQLIATRLDRVTALVNTYQALGGGWSGRIETTPEEALESGPSAAK